MSRNPYQAGINIVNRDAIPRIHDVDRTVRLNQCRREFIVAGALVVSAVILSDAGMAQSKRSSRTGFVPPNAEKRRKAIGSLAGLSPQLKRAFDPSDDFKPIPAPDPEDWLAEHKEAGQTFDQYAAARYSRPQAPRSTMYLIPFGEFDAQWSPKLTDLVDVANAFFQVPVKSLEPQPLGGKQFTTRMNSGKRQFLTTDFLRKLPSLLPDDGYAILGITMDDLYPDPAWEYVFGQASPHDRTGIYSFARYDPLFWKEKRTPESKSELLLRSLGVLLHETGHMFGLSHCIYYHCLMNGANSLSESDAQPMHLCPVCLRKLHHSVGFNIIKRYEALLQQYVRLGIKDEREWLEKRLKFLRDK